MVMTGVKHEGDAPLAKVPAEGRNAVTTEAEVEHRSGNAGVPEKSSRFGNRPRRKNACLGSFEHCRHLERNQRLVFDNQYRASAQRIRASHTSAPTMNPM